jgi:hypothetical protein
VWGTFVTAMTVVCTLLLLAGGTSASLRPGAMLGPGEVLGAPSRTTGIFQTESPLDASRWQSILIHHSSSPTGDASILHRQHQSWGLDGLGFHFIIGNGNGLEDGAIQVGYRWNLQQPGAHAIGPKGEWYNRHAIAICLIGNGESSSFTPRQIETLVNLTRRLQIDLDIPADQVRLHRDIAEIRSPGRYFPEAEFRRRLAEIRD